MSHKLTILLFLATLVVRASETLPSLKVKGEVYTNVTVTRFTTTDVYFTHARGAGNAKLKDLEPEMQKHFHYDPAKGAQAEKDQARANAEYRDKLARTKPPPPKNSDADGRAAAAANEPDFVVPKLYARSYRGQLAPELVVEKWLTPKPDTAGKFLLIDFWATWCPPCRASIPEINAFHSKFKDRLVAIGISDESEQAVHKMTNPRIEYAVAIDTKKRMSSTLAISGIPHCILIDPKGFVRFEGMPQYLDNQKLEHFLNKYAD